MRESHTKRAKTTQKTKQLAPIYPVKVVALLMLKFTLLGFAQVNDDVRSGDTGRLGAVHKRP